LNQDPVLRKYITDLADAPFVLGLGVSLCTVRKPDGNVTSSGGQSGTYVDVTGLVAIQCIDAPDRSPSAQERNTQGYVEATSRRKVLLRGYFALLSPATNWGDAGWIAVMTNTISGEVQTYDIRGAEADSQHSQTYMYLRKVTV